MLHMVKVKVMVVKVKVRSTCMQTLRLWLRSLHTGVNYLLHKRVTQ